MTPALSSSSNTLVTGANGTIGREVVRQLSARGDRVVAMALDFDDPSHFPATGAATFVTGDCREETDVVHALTVSGPIDRVVHLAALSHAGAGTPIGVFSTNVVSTFTVLASAATHGARRAVIASSIHATGVPGNHHGTMPAAFPLTEDDAIVLDDWYSLSKRTDELTAEMVSSRWGMPVVALRFPLVKAPTELVEASRRLVKNPSAGVREGWTYLTLEDAGRAVLCALDAGTDGADVLHVAATETLLPGPTEELLTRFAPGVPWRGRFPGRTAPMDTSRARHRIGFEPRQHITPADPESLPLPISPSSNASQETP
ncbi:NAD-dependent epimerase/dehydratase family protein [Oerskovia enterophila]|uniref:NAD-dependent epimerase/dehydratase family protein n=1 Tax=Oerskovia enterophila TaxID=43678 RepID=UPI0033907BB7